MSTTPQESPISPNPFGSDPVREQRGFALYVGLSEKKARERGIGLVEIVNALRDELRRTTPAAESQALAVVAPVGSPVRDLELVMQAIGKRPPARQPPAVADSQPVPPAVVIDLERHRVLVDGRMIGLTFKELTILETLVAAAGRTLGREHLKAAIAVGHPRDVNHRDINDRTIDVHIRRMRAKLESRADLIETVHGSGYRFEARPNAQVRPARALAGETLAASFGEARIDP